MHGLEILIRISKGKRREFIQAFNFFSSKFHPLKACKLKKLFEDVEEDNLFLWIEQWTDEEALLEHIRSDGFLTLTGAIDVLGNLESMKIVELKSLS